MKNLKGKVAAITGRKSGIDASLSLGFGLHGSTIALIDGDKKSLQKQAELLQSKNMPVIGLQCDITDERQCTVTIGKIIKKIGGIDIVANNAGITQRSLFINTNVKLLLYTLSHNYLHKFPKVFIAYTGGIHNP